MRMKLLLLASVAVTAVAVFAVRPTHAGTYYGTDNVYADSFGNLIIESAAGYKRIVVGQGHRAKEMQGFTSADEPSVVYSDEERVSRDCYRPGLWLQGRSYMYGRSYGEMPPMAACQ